MKLKITFKVQSISDIITNSSSEVFLRIDSKDEKTHNEIYKVMQELFPGNDYEMSPGVLEYAEDGEYSISLKVPYGIEDFETFYEAGIRAILKEKFGEDNYTIIV